MDKVEYKNLLVDLDLSKNLEADIKLLDEYTSKLDEVLRKLEKVRMLQDKIISNSNKINE